MDHYHIESTHRKRRHHEVFEDEVLATALLDRLLHHAEVISIAGPSYRMKDRRLATLKGSAGGQK